MNTVNSVRTVPAKFIDELLEFVEMCEAYESYTSDDGVYDFAKEDGVHMCGDYVEGLIEKYEVVTGS